MHAAYFAGGDVYTVRTSTRIATAAWIVPGRVLFEVSDDLGGERVWILRGAALRVLAWG
jgi:hypothetical protein